MKTLFLLLLALSFNCLAAQDDALLKKLAPDYLGGLDITKPFSKQSAQKELGKPSFHQGEAYYYEFKKFKYPLEIKFDKDKAKSINVVLLDKKVPVKMFLEELRENKIQYESDTSNPTFVVVKVSSLGIKLMAKHSSDYIYSFEKEYK